LKAAVVARGRLEEKQQSRRGLWQKDASLWSNTDEGNWLGWLTITQEQLANLDTLKQFAAEVKKAKFRLSCCWGWAIESLSRSAAA